MRKSPKRRSNCPLSFALDIFGDKWTLLIVRDLLFMGKSSYGDFLRSEENIATNILADRLDALETAAIVTKKKDGANKTKFIYSLTEKGIDLLPAIIEMNLWSAKYDPKTGAPKEFLEQVEKDKEKFLQQIRDGLKQNKFLHAAKE